MAMGRLLGEYVDREARGLTASLRQNPQVLLSGRHAGWSIHGATKGQFFLRHDIARCLGIRPGSAKYKAVANMRDLLRALYCIYQVPKPLKCATLVDDFRRHCTIASAPWYLLSLEHDVDAMLQNIWPFGRAIFCGAIWRA